MTPPSSKPLTGTLPGLQPFLPFYNHKVVVPPVEVLFVLYSAVLPHALENCPQAPLSARISAGGGVGAWGTPRKIAPKFAALWVNADKG